MFLLTPCAEISQRTNKKQLNFHLQCYHLQFFFVLLDRYPATLRTNGLFFGQLGAVPPPPFLSVSPLESMRSGGAIPPPPTEGVSQRYLRNAHENEGKMRAIPPSAILSRKGIVRYGGGGGYLTVILTLGLRWAKTRVLKMDPRVLKRAF